MNTTKRNVIIILVLSCMVRQNSICQWMTDHTARIYVAGHTGLAGTALVTALQKQGYTHIITRNHKELNLEDTTAVAEFFDTEKPEYVFIAAAKVPKPNTALLTPVDILESNVCIISNILRAALNAGTHKVLLIGSLYAYPAECAEPVTENQLFTGAYDQIMQAYGFAKNFCITLCAAYNTQYQVPFITCIPAIIYGPQDLNDTQSTKPIIQIIRAIIDAHIADTPYAIINDSPEKMRDYLYVTDFARACIYLMQHYDGASPINIGSGVGITTRYITEYCAEKIGYTSALIYDEDAYNIPAHLFDITQIRSLGWQPSLHLIENINNLIKIYLQKNDISIT